MSGSFLFYDLETFGADPRRSRIAQFAALRTDAELNPVEAPISLYVRPADDLLPSPTATLITGIDPYQALRDGLTEAFKALAAGAIKSEIEAVLPFSRFSDAAHRIISRQAIGKIVFKGLEGV